MSNYSTSSKFHFLLCQSDDGTPPPAPAPGGMGAPPPPPDFPPRGSSFNHPSLVALQGQSPQQRAATLVVTKDNSDEPPTYEVIPYSTGRWRFMSRFFFRLAAGATGLATTAQQLDLGALYFSCCFHFKLTTSSCCWCRMHVDTEKYRHADLILNWIEGKKWKMTLIGREMSRLGCVKVGAKSIGKREGK